MTNLWHEIERDERTPDVIKVVVETPMGSRNKYVYDKKYNLIRLEKMLYLPLRFPGDYGFIPQTYCEDGNPLDALVIVSEASYPGILLRVRPVALLRIIEKNINDDKLICVPLHDTKYMKIKDKGDLSSNVIEEIEHFFNIYKRLEGKTVKKFEWKNSSLAKKLVLHAMKLYERKFS